MKMIFLLILLSSNVLMCQKKDSLAVVEKKESYFKYLAMVSKHDTSLALLMVIPLGCYLLYKKIRKLWMSEKDIDESFASIERSCITSLDTANQTLQQGCKHLEQKSNDMKLAIISVAQSFQTTIQDMTKKLVIFGSKLETVQEEESFHQKQLSENVHTLIQQQETTLTTVSGLRILFLKGKEQCTCFQNNLTLYANTLQQSLSAYVHLNQEMAQLEREQKSKQENLIKRMDDAQTRMVALVLKVQSNLESLAQKSDSDSDSDEEGKQVQDTLLLNLGKAQLNLSVLQQQFKKETKLSQAVSRLQQKQDDPCARYGHGRQQQHNNKKQ